MVDSISWRPCFRFLICQQEEGRMRIPGKQGWETGINRFYMVSQAMSHLARERKSWTI